MIAPDLFGPGGSNLHNLQVGKGKLPAKRQHLRQRLQGNGVNHHPGQGVFLQNAADGLPHGPAGATDEHMGGGRQGDQSLRRASGNDLHVRSRQPAAVLPNERAALLLPLNGIDPAPPGQKRRLHRHRAGARTHVVNHRILRQAELGQGDRPHLLLGHGNRTPKETFVRQALGHRDPTGPLILHQEAG